MDRLTFSPYFSEFTSCLCAVSVPRRRAQVRLTGCTP